MLKNLMVLQGSEVVIDFCEGNSCDVTYSTLTQPTPTYNLVQNDHDQPLVTVRCYQF